VLPPEAATAHSPADRIAAVIEGIAHAYSLTATEVEVIKLVLDGKSRQEIAELRGTSPNTVKTHVRNLLSKCGLTQTIAFRAYVYRSALYGEFLPLPSNDE
jgi:DNA-binding NarL/FixJ family response regulator